MKFKTYSGQTLDTAKLGDYNFTIEELAALASQHNYLIDGVESQRSASQHAVNVSIHVEVPIARAAQLDRAGLLFTDDEKVAEKIRKAIFTQFGIDELSTEDKQLVVETQAKVDALMIDEDMVEPIWTQKAAEQIYMSRFRESTRNYNLWLKDIAEREAEAKQAN